MILTTVEMKAYSQDLRERVISLHKTSKYRIKAISDLLGIERHTISNWIRRYKENGDYSSRQHLQSGRDARFTNKENIIEFLANNPDSRAIEVGEKYSVDKAKHKITGAFILKSFVRSSLLGRPISLRTLEEIVPVSLELNSLLKTKKDGKNTIDHSSIGKRLKTIKTEYFQAIYDELVKKYHSRFNIAKPL